jgi:hypothetical protein
MYESRGRRGPDWLAHPSSIGSLPLLLLASSSCCGIHGTTTDGGESTLISLITSVQELELICRCLLFKRADWFRTFMAWVHIIAAAFLVTSQWIDVHILYKQVSPLLLLLLFQVGDSELIDRAGCKCLARLDLYHGSYGQRGIRPRIGFLRISSRSPFGHYKSLTPRKWVLHIASLWIRSQD